MRAMNDRDLNIWCDVSTALRDAAGLDSEFADECAQAILPTVRRIAARELRAAARDLAGLPGNPYPLVVTEFLSDRADYHDPPDAA